MEMDSFSPLDEKSSIETKFSFGLYSPKEEIPLEIFYAVFNEYPNNDSNFVPKEKDELYFINNTISKPLEIDQKPPLFHTKQNKKKYLGKKTKNIHNISLHSPRFTEVNKKIAKKSQKRKDNIISFVKRRLYQNVKKCLKKYLILKNVDTSVINGYRKEDHVNFLTYKVEDFFKGKLSKHHNETEKDDCNKREIELFKIKRENNISELLNKTFKEILEIYIKNEHIFEGFKTLEDDKENLKKNIKEESFINNYDYHVKNFVKIVENIKTRKRKN